MTKDGGSAFPETHVPPVCIQGQVIQEGWKGKEGMSLRDYFAGKAMQGLLANSELKRADLSYISDWAYKYADSMIAQKDK